MTVMPVEIVLGLSPTKPLMRVLGGGNPEGQGELDRSSVARPDKGVYAHRFMESDLRNDMCCCAKTINANCLNITR